MCIANAYLIEQGKPILIMENVETAQYLKKDVWTLTGLFGETMQIAARLKFLRLVENQLFFEQEPQIATKADNPGSFLK